MSDIVDTLRRIAGDTPPGHSVMANVNRVREAIDEIERLRSLTTWRPIAEAPKDGTWVLGYCNGLHVECKWKKASEPAPDDYGHDAGWFDHAGLCYAGNSQIRSEDQWPAQRQPTHFLPLPPPPERGDGQ